jgi:hypothetical protein
LNVLHSNNQPPFLPTPGNARLTAPGLSTRIEILAVCARTQRLTGRVLSHQETPTGRLQLPVTRLEECFSAPPQNGVAFQNLRAMRPTLPQHMEGLNRPLPTRLHGYDDQVEITMSNFYVTSLISPILRFRRVGCAVRDLVLITKA